jgi:formylmethanofuran dehydrogenase subunit C
LPLVILPRDALPHAGAIDLSALTPDRLKGLAIGAIERLPVEIDGRPQPLASAFSITGSLEDDGRIECRGDFSHVHGLGAGMRSGRIEADGPVGHRAGARMAGGELVVAGNAGNWLAAGMSGGTVRISGNAADDAAAAFPGETHGVTGGLIMIAGSAGRLAAARMRRGIVAIGGDCGPGAGFELRAGTVIVAGTLGRQAGLGMRRGSIIAAGRPIVPGPTFVVGATWSPPFFRLLERRLQAAGFRPSAFHQSPEKAPSLGWSSATWTQWHGETVSGGRGEFWVRLA